MIQPNQVPTVSVTDAHARLDAADASRGPLLVDVREPHEIEAVRATGVVVMPLSTFMLRYDALPMDRPLLMICESGRRSAQAAAFLLARGWPDVANVAGGTHAWVRAGLPDRRGPLAPGEGDLPG